MIDDKIRIKCTKCSQVFRERAQKVRDGFQTNCHHCNRLITFDMNAEDRNIRKALLRAGPGDGSQPVLELCRWHYPREATAPPAW
jgi:hypothetical protein